MTRDEARQLLDAARGGRNVSELDIRRALRATGDLDSTFKSRPSVLPRAHVLPSRIAPGEVMLPTTFKPLRRCLPASATS